jgi:hypothetical protein
MVPCQRRSARLINMAIYVLCSTEDAKSNEGIIVAAPMRVLFDELPSSLLNF